MNMKNSIMAEAFQEKWLSYRFIFFLFFGLCLTVILKVCVSKVILLYPLEIHLPPSEYW